MNGRKYLTPVCRIGHQLQRAVADEPPRAAGQHLNTDQRVNDRLAGLGDEATARRSGGQGVYPSYYNNDNQFMVIINI